MNRTLFVTNKYPYDIKRIYTSYLVLSHFLFLWWKGTCFFLGIKNILIFYLVWVEHCQKIKISIFWLPTPSSCKWSVWTTPQFGNQGNYQIVIFNKWWFKCWIEYLFWRTRSVPYTLKHASTYLTLLKPHPLCVNCNYGW